MPHEYPLPNGKPIFSDQMVFGIHIHRLSSLVSPLTLMLTLGMRMVYPGPLARQGHAS